MKLLTAFAFGVMISFVGFAVYVRSSNDTKAVASKTPEVLAQEMAANEEPTSEPTETPSPSPEETTKPSPTPKPATIPSPKPTATPFTGNLAAIFDQYTGQYGVDPNYLRHIAECESGFNPAAINGPYAGLFQFHANTWGKYRKEMGMDPSPDLRVNAEEAIRTAAYIVNRFGTNFWPNCR